MLKLGRVTKVNVLFLVLVLVFNFELIQFSAAILEKGLLVDLDPICGEHLSAGVLSRINEKGCKRRVFILYYCKHTCCNIHTRKYLFNVVMF